MRSMLRRAFRAAKLDRATYREVSEDPEAILNAAGVVVLVGIAIGLSLTDAFEAGTIPTLTSEDFTERLLGIWLSVITMMAGWVLWSGIVVVIGKLFLHVVADFRQVLRVLGICYGPGTLLILASVPELGSLAVIVGSLWVLVVGVVALHEAQDVDWKKVSLSTLLGWVIGFWLPSAFLRPI